MPRIAESGAANGDAGIFGDNSAAGGRWKKNIVFRSRKEDR